MVAFTLYLMYFLDFVVTGEVMRSIVTSDPPSHAQRASVNQYIFFSTTLYRSNVDTILLKQNLVLY